MAYTTAEALDRVDQILRECRHLQADIDRRRSITEDILKDAYISSRMRALTPDGMGVAISASELLKELCLAYSAGHESSKRISPQPQQATEDAHA